MLRNSIIFALTLAGAAAAQEAGGWRKFDEAPPAGPAANSAPPAPAMAPLAPPEITVPAGVWITVRVNDLLSSDRNKPGDVFTATLAQPVIANGFVVARRGQTVTGRVAEAVRAGRAKGTSRLAIELTELTLADGAPLAIRTELAGQAGGSSKGTDATAIGTTTGLGAAIGAAADGGFGAGMGAIAGAGAGALGVLLTRGRATEVDPEAILTFRLAAPVTVSTEKALHAYQAVRQEDYEPQRQNPQLRRRTQAVPMWGPAWGGGWGWGPGWGPYWGRGGFGWWNRPYYRWW